MKVTYISPDGEEFVLDKVIGFHADTNAYDDAFVDVITCFSRVNGDYAFELLEDSKLIIEGKPKYISKKED